MFRLLVLIALAWPLVGMAVAGPDCSRPFTLALHDHGLLYDSQTGEGIDKDMADELTRRSGCKINVSLMPRARIWQLIESGALDFSLSGIRGARVKGCQGQVLPVANSPLKITPWPARCASNSPTPSTTSHRAATGVRRFTATTRIASVIWR